MADLGSSFGTLAGYGIGSAYGGPIGGQIGAGIGNIAGSTFDISRNKTPEVMREDPLEIQKLKEIDATRKQIAEGTDPLIRQRISDIKNTGETTKAQLGKYTGGDVGSTLTGMLRAQRNIGAGINQAYSESQNRLPFFEKLSQQLANRISQRKLELDIHAQDQAMAEKAQSQKELASAVSGTIASASGANNLFGGGNSAGIPSMATPGINPMGGMNLPSFTPSTVAAAPSLPNNLAESFSYGLSGSTPGYQGLLGQ